VESRERFELSMFCIGGRVPSAGRDRLESSSGVEPLSVRLEGAGPYSLGEDIQIELRESNPSRILWQRLPAPRCNSHIW